MSKQLTVLTLEDISFPNVDLALDDPEGLLAVGGDLSPQRLLNAYQHAIFPWFSEGEPILWWSPIERAIIEPNKVHISKSMAKFIRQTSLKITINKNFNDVINACSLPRKSQNQTWISTEIKIAYQNLHKLGHAHSIEIWDNRQLVGGLYGINIGGVFCGESMFHQQKNASKLAFIALCQHFDKHEGILIDCQMMTPHLASLGVKPCKRNIFLKQLQQYKDDTINTTRWQQQNIQLKS